VRSPGRPLGLHLLAGDRCCVDASASFTWTYTYSSCHGATGWFEFARRSRSRSIKLEFRMPSRTPRCYLLGTGSQRLTWGGFSTAEFTDSAFHALLFRCKRAR
jgi:hypothetical protein